ncbi:membrane glycoprotein US8 [Panine betaherpesvirus 2]|uniref:Membrane glycoprotein US8 n=1 Tax=Panine betaherpesvirus 2 TaxID=188763 RepID=Q8QRV1_9BETA|nr:membrane glycoprotein US8 [Panine betaherpesvirus 2]AAM00787.1 membrane glycoprotein US8 [Panine betaherpesvirus 2]QXV67905.1 membrane glycoprotein US8 [Panine betaherpesvirus 2]
MGVPCLVWCFAVLLCVWGALCAAEDDYGEDDYEGFSSQRHAFLYRNKVDTYEADCVVRDGVLEAEWRVRGSFFPEDGLLGRVSWQGHRGRRWGHLEAPRREVSRDSATFRLTQRVPPELDYLILNIIPCMRCKPLWCEPRYHIRYLNYGTSMDNLQRLHYEYRHWELGFVLGLQLLAVLMLGYVFAKMVYELSRYHYMRYHACVPQKCHPVKPLY